ncbi:YcjX family protein [Biformimicrobium ophioploci]|nr:YcjX family protein [Microbulbifer sp. NKW57]
MGKTSDRIRALRKSLQRELKDGAEKATWAMERVLDRRVCIGVTGLSGSGKTTLVTSILHQLHNPEVAQLPGFSPALSGGLLGTDILPLLDSGLPPFPFDASIQALSAEPPNWPESTKEESAVEMHLHIKRPRAWRNKMHLAVELRDYPGEWLMDIPLLSMDFQHWCRQQNELLHEEPRKGLAGDLLQELGALDPSADCDPVALAQLAERYRVFLQQCREQARLSYLQPGQVLMPPAGSDEIPALFPLPALAANFAEEAPRPGSWHAVMQAAYNDYCRDHVTPFVERQFRHIDRQLILVDLIGTLYAGEAAVRDMRMAFRHIANAFEYGKGNFLTKLFRPRIEKLIFAATKSDQVLAADHDALRQLLGQQLRQAFNSARISGLPLYCEAISAVRSSSEIVRGGRRILAGFDMQGRHLGFENAEILPDLPASGGWQHYRDAAPPKLRPPTGLSAHAEIPHIRVDVLLNLLLGDKTGG